MARRHSAPEVELCRFLESKQHSNASKGTESLGCIMSSSYRELPSPAPVPVPAPRLLEIVVSQGAGTRTSRPPLRHRPPLTTDIDEYVSEILVESLHWLGDQLESVSNALGGSVNVLEKEIKVRLQNTAANTVVYDLNRTSSHSVLSNSEESYSQELERINERASSLHRLHQLFEVAPEKDDENYDHEEEKRTASPAGSLVDSLDEPPPSSLIISSTTTNAASLSNPQHSCTDKSEAFFIRIDDGSCERDTVKVADHMPEKIRKSLNRRQRKREKRIERARRMRLREEKEKLDVMLKRGRSPALDGKEARRECAAVLHALVEAVAAAVAAESPETPYRRRSRIPVRVAERSWNHMYASPPTPHSTGTIPRRRPRPRPPHATLFTPRPLASCS